jgi:DNA primase
MMTMLELMSRYTELRKVASTEGGEYAGPCPWCGGKDRFRVWPHGDRPRCWCRRCEWRGDAIQFLRDFERVSYREACQRLHLPVTGRLRRTSVPPRPKAPPLAKAPATPWQAKARAFTEQCEACLWSPEGRQALTYLHRRGLHDETLQMAHVGYHPAEHREPREAWGLLPDPERPTVWLPQGIVFPWHIGAELWRVTIRCTGPDIPSYTRYIALVGGSNPLYLADCLRPNAPAMLVEGTLDALSVLQEAGDLIAVVAASTTWGRLERWIGRLALASIVLLGFDADEGGEAAVAWWLKALGSRAKRWRPYWDDPNAMLQGGADLRGWIREGLGQKPRWWRKISRWPEEQRELLAERAAIMEMDAGFIRDEAELTAYLIAGSQERA